jgi:predicted alpha/beta-hydrolase family hydrolase
MPLVDAFPIETQWRVAVGADETSAAYRAATAPHPRGLFICGPSAGGHLAEPGMLRLARPLQQAGLGVVLFNFLYREHGRRRPDPMPELQRCFAAVVASALERIGPTGLVLLGGRSMGGRVASMLAADGTPCDGLLLLAYPLHPAGQPERLRAAHLPRVDVHTLCFNGTRDRLCSRDLMETAIAPLGRRWTMHWLEGADHGFDVLRSSGRTEADIEKEIGEATQAWLDQLERRAA